MAAAGREVALLSVDRLISIPGKGLRPYMPNYSFQIYQLDKSLHIPGRKRKLAEETRYLEHIL